MSARTKPLAVVAPSGAAKLTSIASYTLPDKQKQVKMISPDNVAELVKLLHEEAKVI